MPLSLKNLKVEVPIRTPVREGGKTRRTSSFVDTSFQIQKIELDVGVRPRHKKDFILKNILQVGKRRASEIPSISPTQITKKKEDKVEWRLLVVDLAYMGLLIVFLLVCFEVLTGLSVFK